MKVEFNTEIECLQRRQKEMNIKKKFPEGSFNNSLNHILDRLYQKIDITLHAFHN